MSPKPAASESPRHVVLIQADDLGFHDLACHGNPHARTPWIDRLAAESVQCRDFTVNAHSAPSRAALLTGRHFLRTGVSHVHGGKDFLHPGERTLADVFLAHQWKTGLWGKWHLGHGPGYFPWERGFEEALMLDLYQHRDCQGSLNGSKMLRDRWADHLIFDHAIDFLRRHRNQRGFVYIPTMTPHTPLAAPSNHVRPYLDAGLSNPLAELFGMITFLDEQVGRLMRFLEDTELAADTLLIFTSDNGPAHNRDILSHADRALRNSGPWRGWKGDLWENGVRAPLLLRWPRRLNPRIVESPLDHLDLFPTLVEWCSLRLPKHHPTLDGSSRCALLEAGDTAPDAPAPIFQYAHPGWLTSERPDSPTGLPGEYNPVAPEDKDRLNPIQLPLSIRLGRFKLVLNPFPPSPTGDPTAPASSAFLVNLHDDPAESHNLATELPGLVAQLQDQLTQWFHDILDEPASFGAPVLSIDPTPGSLTALPARVPYRTSATLQNSVDSLRNWFRPGDCADYLVQCTTAVAIDIRLHWIQPPPAGWTFSLATPDMTTEGATDGSPLTPLGGLRIPPGTTSLQLALGPLAAASSDSPPNALSEIQLVVQ